MLLYNFFLYRRTRLDGAVKMSNYITCLCRTVLEVSYLFHAESAQNYHFKNAPSRPPPVTKIEWWAPYTQFVLVVI